MARTYFIKSQNSGVRAQDNEFSVLSANGSEIKFDFFSFAENEKKELPKGSLTFSDRKTAKAFMESLDGSFESMGKVLSLESFKEVA